jgi:hypothetical protein
MTVAGFCGSVPVISYGNDNSLIGMGHRNFPKVLIYETGNIAFPPAGSLRTIGPSAAGTGAQSGVMLVGRPDYLPSLEPCSLEKR